MDLSLKFLQCLLIVVIFIYTVESWQCIECNSGGAYDGPVCANGTKQELDKFIVNCSESRNYTRCRKAVQTVGSDIRTVRSCATIGKNETKCVDRTGTSGVRVQYCECNKELCNGSSGFIAPILLICGLALNNAFANAS